MNLNKTFVLGRLTRDPEGRETKNGAPVCTFAVATNRTWTQDGEKREETEFHNIVVFGNQGKDCAQWLTKGSLVLVEGRLQTRSWEDDAGVTRSRTEIVADRVTFGPRASGESDESWADKKVEERKAQQGQKTGRGYEYPEETIRPEDIPF